MKKPTAVIVDVDGTLCDVSSVRHHVVAVKDKKDFDAFHREAEHCPPHQSTIEWCQEQYDAGHQILIVTGRMEQWRQSTDRFVWRHLFVHGGVPFEGLWMRPQGDYRKDTEIKREIHAMLSEHWDIVAAIDDNPSIVALWEDLGIPVTVVPGWDTEAAASYVKAQENHGAQP